MVAIINSGNFCRCQHCSTAVYDWAVILGYYYTILKYCSVINQCWEGSSSVAAVLVQMIWTLLATLDHDMV